MKEMNIASFYAGQKVMAVDALDGSAFKNGQTYTVAATDYKLGNKNHLIGRVTYYWYVGIVGFADGGAYYRPSIFAPIEEKFQSISLEKVLETETPFVCSN